MSPCRSFLSNPLLIGCDSSRPYPAAPEPWHLGPRFSPDMHLPGDVILKLLRLETECYEPGCPPAHEEFPKPFLFNYTAPLSRIVDKGRAARVRELLKGGERGPMDAQVGRVFQ